MSRKPLSDGEQSLLQKGPKFAVSSSKAPLTEYIAVTKRICNELSENTAGRDCTVIYQKIGPWGPELIWYLATKYKIGPRDMCSLALKKLFRGR